MTLKDVLQFLRELAANNNRVWFNDHKDIYQQVKATTEELCRKLVDVVSETDSRARWLTPANCMYRIYRDTRFSPDKTPYKTHIGIFINPPLGKKGPTCGYYLHIEPNNCFFCAGTIGLPGNVITAIRKSIYDEIDEYRSIVEDPAFKKYFTQLGEDPLKTAPKGFPKDWGYLDYVRPRNFIAMMPLTHKFICRKDLVTALREPIVQAGRFNRFVNYTIEEMLLTNPQS